LYEIGDLSAEKKEILKRFIDFSKMDKYQKLASEYGYNRNEEYNPEIGI